MKLHPTPTFLPLFISCPTPGKASVFSAYLSWSLWNHDWCMRLWDQQFIFLPFPQNTGQRTGAYFWCSADRRRRSLYRSDCRKSIRLFSSRWSYFFPWKRGRSDHLPQQRYGIYRQNSGDNHRSHGPYGCRHASRRRISCACADSTVKIAAFLFIASFFILISVLWTSQKICRTHIKRLRAD